jgi:methionyl-tRNA formyltransferase
MGTPEFSVPALCALRDNQHDVVAVVTNPDRPKGRGRRVVASPVKQAARTFGYPLLQPTRATESWFLDKITGLAPDLLIVVAYGQILAKNVLSIPRLGAINIHASLLPKYRGPAPIQWAIMNCEEETGVTTMWLDEGMDTGDVLLAARVSIGTEETAQTLHDRLAKEGANLLIDTLEQLASGDLVATPQNHLEASYAPLLKKEDGRIDWTKDARTLDAFVRGMNPWPGALTYLEGKRFRIFRARAVRKETDVSPGTVLDSFPGDFHVATGQEVLSLLQVQFESGKRLAVADFLRGVSVSPGTVLG